MLKPQVDQLLVGGEFLLALNFMSKKKENKNKFKGFFPTSNFGVSLPSKRGFTQHQKSGAGFTLIELLVVIAIIGLLASVVLVSLNSARFKSRTAKRVADLSQLQKALELYYSENNAYPVSPSDSQGPWAGITSCWGPDTALYIPGLVPTYLPKLPTDPKNSADCDKQYIYNSNGTDYKLIAHNAEDILDVIAKYPNLVDPGRPTWAFGNWSPGGAGF